MVSMMGSMVHQLSSLAGVTTRQHVNEADDTAKIINEGWAYDVIYTRHEINLKKDVFHSNVKNKKASLPMISSFLSRRQCEGRHADGHDGLIAHAPFEFPITKEPYSLETI